MGSGDARWGRCTRRALPDPAPWFHQAPCGDLCLLHTLRTMEYTLKMLFLLSAQMLVMLTHSHCVLKVWGWDVTPHLSPALQHYHLFAFGERQVYFFPLEEIHLHASVQGSCHQPPACYHFPVDPITSSPSFKSGRAFKQNLHLLASDLVTTAPCGLSTHQENIPFLLHTLKLPPTSCRKELWGIHGPTGSSGTQRYAWPHGA